MTPALRSTCAPWLVALILAGASCARKESPAPSPPPAPVVSPAPAASAPAPPRPAPETAETPPPEDLVQDQRDRDPRSEIVTIKILADARRQARVFWGRKDLGLAPLDLQRPRNSGPLDLLVIAPDYLPLHTRVFTDRDDKLWLRLYTVNEAPQVLGYRPPEHLQPPAEAPKPRSKPASAPSKPR